MKLKWHALSSGRVKPNTTDAIAAETAIAAIGFLVSLILFDVESRSLPQVWQMAKANCHRNLKNLQKDPYCIF